jgi:hypothetical protein
VLDRRETGLAVLVALVLLSGVATAVVRGPVRASAVRAAQEDADRALPELVAFVERTYGAPFPRPVVVEVLDQRAYDAAVRRVDERATAGDAAFHPTMVALRIADPDDPPAEFSPTPHATPSSLYDPATDRLYLPPRPLTPYARLLLVHDLAHAWQDQRYDLAALLDAPDRDARAAARALVEGHAARAEGAWRYSRPQAEQDALDAFENDLAEATTGERTKAERAAVAAATFDQVYGSMYAGALASAGAVERTFRDPPRSTAQILHHQSDNGPPPPPERVTAPAPRGRLLDSGTLGELWLGIVLTGGDVDPPLAAAGWAGDAYVTWHDGTRQCTGIAVRMRSADARDRLAAALRERPLGNGGIVRRDGPRGLLMLACVP